MKSLGRKLILSYIILTTVTLTVVGSIYFTVIHAYTRSLEREYLLGTARNIAPHVRSFLQDSSRRSASAGFIRAASALGGIEIRILNEDGSILADFTETAGSAVDGPLFPGMNPALEDMLLDTYRPGPAGGPEPGFPRPRPPLPLMHMMDRMKEDFPRGEDFQLKIDRELSGRKNTVFLIEHPRRVLYLELHSTSGYLETLNRSAVIGFTLSAVAALLASTLIGFFISRRFSRPITELTTTARAMEEGDLSARSGIIRKDEIGLLAEGFNSMADSLQENISSLASERDSLKEFLQDASHEMRTPLTSLLTFNELLEGPAGDDSVSRKEYIRDSMLQLRRLKTIVDDLLTLSRLQGGIIQLHRETHSLREIINTARSLAEQSCGSKRIRWDLPTLNRGEDVLIMCDRDRFITVLANIFRNGILAVNDGGSISCGIRCDENRVIISITDDGPGVMPGDLPRIFDRFYRSPHNSAAGSGLGLAIARSIVEAHGGTIEAVSPVHPDGGGFRIVMYLPS